jgi:anti-sigma B factor antagonist
MQHETTRQDGFVIVSLSGEVDLSSASEVRRLILEHVAAGAATLVNLAAVTYIDSSGIACLVEGHQAAKRKGSRFGLLQISEPVLSVLALARLDKVFALYSAVPAPIRA